MIRRAQKPVSQRQLRVGEELRHALAQVFEHGTLRDPALVGVSVTVTEVRISPDLTNATAFVMPLGGANIEAVVAALRHAGPFLRRELARSVKLRHAPNLSFQADESFAEASRIDALLRDPAVARDLERAADEDGLPSDDAECGLAPDDAECGLAPDDTECGLAPDDAERPDG